MTAYDCIASSHFLSVQIADWRTGLKTYQPGRKGGEGVREREVHHLDTYVGSGHLYIIILDSSTMVILPTSAQSPSIRGIWIF